MPIRFKVTKPGYDVLSEPDPNNYIYHSDYNHLKTKTSGSFTELIPYYDIVNISIAHGLNYIPLAMCYFRNTADDKWFINLGQPTTSEVRSSINANVSMYMDDTYINFRINNSTDTDMTIEVKYEIFYEGDN